MTKHLCLCQEEYAHLMRRTKITFFLGELIYYLFKIFLSFSLAQIPRLILENQLALTKSVQNGGTFITVHTF